MAPSANVESKKRSADHADVARRAEVIGARYGGQLSQVDTYFRVPSGRLKLRELVHVRPNGRSLVEAELIAYDRPDVGGARVSCYDRTTVEDAVSTKLRLEADHGIRGVVRKERELWLVGATRIHLDRVEGLGGFVELETVAREEPGEDERVEHDRVAAALAIDLSRTVEVSYIDLLERDWQDPRR